MQALTGSTRSSVVLAYDAPAPDPVLDALVHECGEKMCTALLQHQYSCWRLAKLRRLKEQYDPHNCFGFYAPIQ
ncbi:hypothetical protein B0T26DRAFT_753566 [Lasiosphaeria miniovina]|uniref:Berberine/berberine-like domain-containing protein n=1 Tax=Lasiosphaeria miniovina TaxID=1954250 RepID=A0AA40DRG3_9PEZI|nr:uncharacterized protein B0T26DRAFT_753566 [Lasiosphaeria miniovina]KAK0713464.1 hypothetical protein B0T26DRAFT_753566 [Lasiosphaeria miniovina]